DSGAVRAGERGAAAPAREDEGEGAKGRSEFRAQSRGAGGRREALPPPALGRPGAARGHRARRGLGSFRAPGRRADGGSRPQVGRRDSRSPGASQPGVQEDDRHGDARSARCRARAPRAPPREGRAVGMSLLSLVLANLGRNKTRTILTVLSVFIALFLFCALRGVLDTLDSSVRVSSETRVISRNAISLIFPLPLSYRDRIATVPGVKS